jgi:hypothetical protein
MSWYAVDALDEAVAETRGLLSPFDPGTWLRLAVITAFAGLSAPQTPTFSPEAPPEVVVEASRTFTLSEFLSTFAVVGAAILAVAAVVAAVGAVMEFVLVDVARTRGVRVAEPFRRWLGPGLRLLGFRAGRFPADWSLTAARPVRVARPLLAALSWLTRRPCDTIGSASAGRVARLGVRSAAGQRRCVGPWLVHPRWRRHPGRTDTEPLDGQARGGRPAPGRSTRG